MRSRGAVRHTVRTRGPFSRRTLPGATASRGDGRACGVGQEATMLDESSTIAAFLEATAARRPTPGGGGVTALTGALSAAIGEMVVNYSLGKKGLEAYQDELRPAVEELTRARKLMLTLMAEDQSAYAAPPAAPPPPRGAPPPG